MVLIGIISAVVSLFTQYTAYIVIIIGVDILILNAVKNTQTKPEFQSADRDAFNQVLISAFIVGVIFMANAMFTWAVYQAPDVTYHSWSYMILESLINVVLLVMGIFLVRAYVRCEKLEVAEGVAET
jgi:uncharacterized membrane protein